MTIAPEVRTGARHLRHGVDPEEAIADLRLALVSRALDDREISLQKQSRVYFQISGAGHEALLLAMARHLKPGYDWFFPYYRDRALMLGLGVTPLELMYQSVGSASDPSSGGRQMPSHWGHRATNVVTQSSPTGSQCIPAVGCAEGGRYIVSRGLDSLRAHDDEITYVSLGEGATSEGEFWEALAAAARLRLPVLFLVADNGYAISVPASDQSPAPVADLVAGFRGLHTVRVDGCDYFEARRVARDVVDRLRGGGGPVLVHADVVRPYSHSAADTQAKYRSRAELVAEAERDPIDLLARELVEAGVLDDLALAALRTAAYEEVAAAAKQALEAPRPDPSTVLDNVVAIPVLGEPVAPSTDGEEVAFGESIRRTLHELLASDPRIRVFGEDVADAPDTLIAEVEGKGGVFGTTLGLQRTFGSDRCFNTPLAEAGIIGRGVGQAIRGLRPSPEIQFFDYIWPAMQQLKSEAATTRWRSNGAYTCPMVVRVPIGGYLTGGAIWHSQCGESIFTHVPGLVVMFPSCADDAAGMLRAAFRCEDPVLFLEHKHLLRQPYTRAPFPAPDFVVPIGRARIVRPGDALSLVTYGATVERCRRAADQLSGRGHEVEVVDLRFLSPWDQETVGASVAKTSRVVVVHEDIRTSGFGAEVAAWIAENCFDLLDAPVGRVGALDCHVPYEPTLETAVLPQVDDIVGAAVRVLGY